MRLRHRLVLLTALLALVPATTRAQAIIVGPNSQLVWDEAADVPTASGFTFNATVDAAAPKALTGVTCVAGTAAGTSTCSTLLSQIGLGSHTVTLTSQSGTTVSAPSAPFTFVAILIPVPGNLRLKQD